MEKKASILAVACMMVLAGCGQSEQKTEQQTNTATQTGSATTTSETNKKNAYDGTISGVISDSMCGADHSGMGNLGKDPVACTNKCVEQGAKYVLISDSGDIYQLTDTSRGNELAGKAVSIEGHIDDSTKAIHVHSMKVR